jgi:hypothetical protein
MKELLLKSTKKVAILAALFGVISLNSCKDDDPVEPVVQAEDGFYVSGAATPYAGLDIKASLTSTRNEVTQTDRAVLMQVFVALKGGQAFNITQVAGTTQTVWGPSADFATVANGSGTTDEPKVDFQRGGIEVTANSFTVPADGLYQVIIDTEVGRCAIVPVNWTIIGQATPGGWSGGTALTAGSFDGSTMTWSIKDVTMSGGEWKFRYSDGWKVEIDTAYDLGDGKKGIKANTNFGNSTAGQPFSSDLVFGGDNFNNNSGIYDISITWTAGAGNGHTAVVTRTAGIPARDYSNVSVGLIGDGVKDGNWDGEKFASTPAKSGDVYTWAYNGVELVSTGGFKLRTAGTWDDINVGYAANMNIGPNADDIQESGGNMQVKADGTYDIVFVIDAADNDKKTISWTKK